MTDRTLLWEFLFLATLCGLVLASPSYHRQKRSRMCYGALGCFSTEAPFNNTDGLLPQSPAAINTTFRLYTRTCPSQRIVTMQTRAVFEQCDFDPSLPVKFILHGFLQHGTVSWIHDMAAALLDKEPMNVISVDWGLGSGFPYSQASANTRVVGAEVARMINFLQSRLGVSASLVHITGHSLGAHAAGYAGNQITGLSRITGLDPAEPDFSNTDDIVHLDKTDAQFVDIIHSDDSEFDYYSGFGWMEATGHVDFYPNGGEYQPGCPTESVGNLVSAAYYHGFDDAEDVLSCSHSRAIYLFMESINSPCPFFAHPCGSLAALDSNEGNCFRCPGGVCPEMGYHAATTARGKYYLRTRGSSPFCGYSQHVEVEFGTMERATGELQVELVGADTTHDGIAIKSGTRPFISSDVRETVFIDRQRLDHVTQVRLTFHQSSHSWWWTSSHVEAVSIFKVTVTSSNDGRSIHFCGDHTRVSNGATVTLTRSTTDPNECHLIPFSEDTFNV